ncbi:MAG: carboxypeptidase-like regulatory domain-containing protein [Candidatus Polarisedimenticolia bacterium]
MSLRRAVLLLVILTAFGLTAGGASAQIGIGQVNGTVFDTGRKGVPGLPVAVIPEDGRALYGTSTDADGRYGVKGMPPGIYTVIVAVPGGGMRKDGIRIRPLFRSIVDFTMGTTPSPLTLPALKAGQIAPAAPAAGTVPAASPGPEASDTETPAAPPTDGDALGITLMWSLQGPERSSAPDAWVAAIPVQGSGVLRRDRTNPEGGAHLLDVRAGTYSLLVKAAGFMTWRMGPLPLEGAGELKVQMSLVPYPMGFKGTIEDVLVPWDPIPLK